MSDFDPDAFKKMALGPVKGLSDSLDTLDKNTDKVAKNFKDLIEIQDEYVKQQRKSSKDGGKKFDPEAEGSDAGDKFYKGFNERTSRAVMKGGFLTSISYALQNVVQGFDPLHAAFRGVVGQEIKFMQQMRAIAVLLFSATFRAFAFNKTIW